MKKFLTICAMICAIGLSAPDAEARKFGGSRSMGKTFRTAPSQPAAATANKPINTQNPTLAGQTSKKSGFMGGLLGGLLAGGLFAALLGGGAFSGLQGFDMFLIALLVMGGLYFWRSRQRKARQPASTSPFGQQAAYAASGLGGHPHGQHGQHFETATSAQATGFANSDVPFRLPPGFEMNSFLSGACDHYRTLQGAWNSGDLEKIREYVSPELFEQLRTERASYSGEQHTEVMYVDTQLVRADHGQDWAQVSVKFSGRYMDRQEKVESDINELWHLERDLRAANAPWFIVGIEELD
ncbi:MAG: Tim44 domain-containing protein [Aeromonas sp.]